jgi:hypothetical protein
MATSKHRSADDWFNKVFIEALQGVVKVKDWLTWMLESVVVRRIMDVISAELGSEAARRVREGVIVAVTTAPDPYCGRERCAAMCKAGSRRCPNRATFGHLCYVHFRKRKTEVAAAVNCVPKETANAIRRSAAERAKVLLRKMDGVDRIESNRKKNNN